MYLLARDLRAIGIDETTHRIYLANEGDNTVSVIDGQNNTKIKDIPVGESASTISVDPFSKTVYVANRYDNSVSTGI